MVFTFLIIISNTCSLKKTKYKSIKKYKSKSVSLHFYMENTYNVKFIILTIFKYKFLWQWVHFHCCYANNFHYPTSELYLLQLKACTQQPLTPHSPSAQPLTSAVTVCLYELAYPAHRTYMGSCSVCPLWLAYGT